MKNTTSHKKRGLFDEHSSYVKHTLIPLLGFSGYHQTVSEEEGDAKFVGRKPIIDRLGLWLADLKSANGAYLITGYRGMGKSSLVGQVLYKLTGGAPSIRYKILFWVVYLCVVACSGMFVCCDMPVGTVMGWLLISIAASLLFVVWFLRDKSAEKRHFLIIKLNVGRETLGNREILHLIVKNAYDKFNEFAHDYECNLSYHIASLFIKIVVTTLLFRYLYFPTFPSKNEYLAWFIDIFRLTGEKIGETGALIYFLVLYLLVYLLGQRLLAVFSRLIPFPFQTCYMLSQRLYRLHERSIATVSDDLASINRHIVLSLFRRKQYQPPTVHEMEQELISVFADMEKLLMRRPRFIIVLDELDKVEPSADDSEKDVIPEFNPSAVGGIGGKNSPVNRQRELLRMLSDMKYFMSTVRAKFIFIAGRELYDAYLKDVSDREYSVSSIFNGVINVNSFLKSGDSQGDITSMTEALLCSRLMKGSGRTLAVYYKEEKARIADSKNREVQQKRLDRNIVLLYQFILYLVHISNGSPKKIAIYLEQYIRSREYLQDIKHLTLEESPAECGYYLSFGCKDIQKIGFVHYLVYPVTQVMVNKSRVYGDKLLLSTSFVINQIYKYHNTGFSWRNLEHIPELLEINKMPELRDFIGGIVSFLRKTHLTRILSGLYLFKFPMKISEEISFMSKQSEDLSALFNFSQDESRSIRRHYTNLLEYYTRDINKIATCELHAMASIHHILGDLYQEEEDYSQALFEYQTGLQLLSRQLQEPDYDKDAHWVSSMLFLVRNMLKMGLTYEKRKTLDSAYLAYGELVQRMVDFRYLKEGNFGLRYRLLDETGRTDKEALLFFDAKDDSPGAQTMFPGFGEACQKEGFAFQCDHLKTEFARLLTPLKNSVITRMAFFDDIRIAYLPILAKLSVLEKMNMEGITQHNLDVAEAEFFFLHLATDDSEKVMAVADFYNKMGDILYYKNGIVNSRPSNLFQALYFWGYDLGWLKDTICRPFLTGNKSAYEKGSDYHYYRKIVESWFDEPASDIQKGITTREGLKYYLRKEVELRIGMHCGKEVDWDEIINYSFDDYIPLFKVKACMEHRERFSEAGLRAPCYACKYYNHSLNFELERMMGWRWTADKREDLKAVIVAELLLSDGIKIRSMRETQHSIIGDTLKGLGCTYLGCADRNALIRGSFLDYFFRILQIYYEDVPLFLGKPPSTPNKLEKAMLLFWEASIFYEMTGDSRTPYELNKHLIDILNAYLKVHGDVAHSVIKRKLKEIKKYIIDRAIRDLYAHYDHIHLVEIQKMKDIFEKDAYDDIDLDSLSISPDIEELLYGYYILLIQVGEGGEYIKKLYQSELLGPYKHICTLTQDVQNLKMKAILHEQTLRKVLCLSEEWDFASVREVNCADFYKALTDYLDREEELEVPGLYVERKENRKKQRIELLEFLISDALFCLTKIQGLITPLNNTTLYTNTFMGEISEHLWNWTVVFDLTSICFQAADKNYADLFEVLVRKYEVNRCETKDAFVQAALCVRKAMKEWRLDSSVKVSMAETLKSAVLKLISIDTFRHLTKTEQLEAVLRFYERGIDMHSEGKTYKEMIRTLYFLDDDLNNDTCQLAFSVERFLIHSGWIQENRKKIKKQSSSIYNSDKYFRKS